MKPEQIKYILENIDKKSPKKIAGDLGLKERKVKRFLESQTEHKQREIRPQLQKDKSSLHNVRVFIALLLFGLALYHTPLQSKEFYFDDHFAVENNQAIRHIDIPRIFDAFNTRFLTGLSFALNYRWCGLNPFGYRLTDLLIHCLNSFLVFLLIKTTLSLNLARQPMLSDRLKWAAIFASVLFLCHPLQTEPVNFITQRFVLMGTFFYLLTLVLFIQYRSRSKRIFLIASIGTAIAAMFCKEFVVTLPIMLVLYDFYFLAPLAEPWWKRCRRILPFFVVVLIVPLLLLRTPSQTNIVANIADSNIDQESSAPSSGIHRDITRARNSAGRVQYFLTELNVMRTYVRLLFLPVNQDLDYDYPVSYQIDGKTLLSGIFLLCLLAIAIVTCKSKRIVSFSILWFFIALSVESSFIPIGDVITEYRPYLASVGFVSLISILIYENQTDLRKLNTIAALVLIGFSIFTYQRNKIWKNEFTLWNDTVQKSPYKARPYENRGFLYFQQGNTTQALLDYNKAITLNPGYIDAYNNRGNAYLKLGNTAKALSDYNKAIKLYPGYALAYYNRGLIYYNQDNDIKAMADLNKSIEIDPSYADAYINRGNIYKRQNNFARAMSDYNRAIELDPMDPKPYNNRAVTYYYLKNYDMAWTDVRKAEELGYAVSPILINLLKQAK